MLTAAGPKFTREPNVGPAEERETAVNGFTIGGLSVGCFSVTLQRPGRMYLVFFVIHCQAIG